MSEIIFHFGYFFVFLFAVKIVCDIIDLWKSGR